MPLKNTRSSFGTIAKSFHWLMAFLVISLLAVGLYMTGMELSPDKFKVYGLHKSFGIAVLALVFLRVLWRIFSVQPDALATHKTSEKILAALAHLGLYCGMIIMPLTGWLMSSAKGFSVSVFNSFTLPDLVKPDEKLAELFVEIHELAAYTLIAVILLHFAGAVKHHIIDKDITLKRMLPNFKKQG